MTPKEYLSQVKRLNILINQRMQEKTELQQYLFSGAGAVRYDKDKVPNSPQGEAPFTRTIENIDELERDINSKIDELFLMKNRIISEIHALSDASYIDLLYRKYIQLQPLKRIAAEMGYSYQSAVNLHGWALKAFEEAFPDYFQKDM